MSRSQQNEDNDQPEYYRNRETNNNNREMRLSNPSIREYFQEEDEIKNAGYIDERKMCGNIRILALNPNGYKPNDIVKMSHLMTAIKNYEIDVVMMNETNTKWDTVNISKMERRMKRVSRGAQIITADSKQ